MHAAIMVTDASEAVVASSISLDSQASAVVGQVCVVPVPDSPGSSSLKTKPIAPKPHPCSH